jgi:hypothetical protein
MRKTLETVIEVCDDCETYPIRYECNGCGKSVCSNCKSRLIEFQRRVKTTNLNIIYFCPDCVDKKLPLVKQLQLIQRLRHQWFNLVKKYDKLASEAERGIDEY